MTKIENDDDELTTGSLRRTELSRGQRQSRWDKWAWASDSGLFPCDSRHHSVSTGSAHWWHPVVSLINQRQKNLIRVCVVDADLPGHCIVSWRKYIEGLTWLGVLSRLATDLANDHHIREDDDEEGDKVHEGNGEDVVDQLLRRRGKEAERDALEEGRVLWMTLHVENKDLETLYNERSGMSTKVKSGLFLSL